MTLKIENLSLNEDLSTEVGRQIVGGMINLREYSQEDPNPFPDDKGPGWYWRPENVEP
jgi:hypothetical protein